MKMEKVTEELCDQHGTCRLSFWRESLKGLVQDYCIHFKEERHIEFVVDKALGLVKQLFEKLKWERRIIKARLIAKINFTHLVHGDDISYYFASYQAEVVNDVEDFFIRHMQKIASRLETFNYKGSNLVINNIDHLHIALSMI